MIETMLQHLYELRVWLIVAICADIFDNITTYIGMKDGATETNRFVAKIMLSRPYLSILYSIILLVIFTLISITFWSFAIKLLAVASVVAVINNAEKIIRRKQGHKDELALLFLPFRNVKNKQLQKLLGLLTGWVVPAVLASIINFIW